MGHEVVGQVHCDGAGFRRGDLVTATVRRSCRQCENCLRGACDSCLSGRCPERGIRFLDGFASELFTETASHLVRIPAELGRLGVLVEPTSVCERGLRHARIIGERQPWACRRSVVLGAGAIGMLSTYLLRLQGAEVWVLSESSTDSERADVARASGARYISTSGADIASIGSEIRPDLLVEATGSARVLLDALGTVAPSGVVCVLGVDPSDRLESVPASVLAEAYVEGNRALVGSVNAAPEDWVAAVADLVAMSRRFPNVLDSLIGLRVPPDRFSDAFDFEGVKATIRMAG